MSLITRTPARLDRARVKALLDKSYDRLARPDFILDDPIQIPRLFPARADAELIGFLTATIAWGQRKTIIRNARMLAQRMDDAPHDFVINATEAELEGLSGFVHRTFNSVDLVHFIRASRHLIAAYGDLEQAFLANGELGSMATAITRFK